MARIVGPWTRLLVRRSGGAQVGFAGCQRTTGGPDRNRGVPTWRWRLDAMWRMGSARNAAARIHGSRPGRFPLCACLIAVIQTRS